MSSISKSAKSRRKRQRGGDRKIAIDFIDVQFLHEMVGGETGFNLGELTLPGGSGSFTNPSPAVVASAANNMRTKLELYNGAGKRVVLGQEMEVVGTQVNFVNITAGVGEIFFGVINNVPRTGADFLDGEVKTSSGFLIPGETLFTLGFDYRIGEKISATNRKGQLQVERNRLTQYVNTAFETAGPAQNGDYAHVRAGNTAFGTVIEFNSPGTILPSGLPEFINVESRTIFVDRNNLSLRSELESQQGSLLAMAAELGIIQSIDPNIFFQGKPSVIQTKQFSDIVIGMLDLEISQVQREFISWQENVPTHVGGDIKLGAPTTQRGDSLIELNEIDFGDNTGFVAKFADIEYHVTVAATSASVGQQFIWRQRFGGGGNALSITGSESGVSGDTIIASQSGIMIFGEHLLLDLNGTTPATINVGLVATRVVKLTLRQHLEAKGIL